MSGVKLLSKNMGAQNLYTRYKRGLDIFGLPVKNTPEGYSPLKCPPPNAQKFEAPTIIVQCELPST